MEKVLIEKDFPYPIASTFRKYRLIDEDNYSARHDVLGDLFEIIVKFLAIVSVQDFRIHRKFPPYLENFLKKMLHPHLVIGMKL